MTRLKFHHYFLFLFYCVNSNAQISLSNDFQLHQKYQNYRQKFLKHFIALTPSNISVNGAGLPINNINFFHYGIEGQITDPNIVNTTKQIFSVKKAENFV